MSSKIDLVSAIFCPLFFLPYCLKFGLYFKVNFLMPNFWLGLSKIVFCLVGALPIANCFFSFFNNFLSCLFVITFSFRNCLIFSFLNFSLSIKICFLSSLFKILSFLLISFIWFNCALLTNVLLYGLYLIFDPNVNGKNKSY